MNFLSHVYFTSKPCLTIHECHKSHKSYISCPFHVRCMSHHFHFSLASCLNMSEFRFPLSAWPFHITFMSLPFPISHQRHFPDTSIAYHTDWPLMSCHFPCHRFSISHVSHSPSCPTFTLFFFFVSSFILYSLFIYLFCYDCFMLLI